MRVWNSAEGDELYWDGTAWRDGEVPAKKLVVGGQQVVGQRQPPILSPSGGTIIDVEARAAIASVVATLMSHGLID
jgi:hypothetical protein